MAGTRVKDVMAREVTTLQRNETLSLADDIMNLGRIRHLPVLDDDGQELVGIVSQRDLFRGTLCRDWSTTRCSGCLPSCRFLRPESDIARLHPENRHPGVDAISLFR